MGGVCAFYAFQEKFGGVSISDYLKRKKGNNLSDAVSRFTTTLRCAIGVSTQKTFRIKQLIH